MNAPPSRQSRPPQGWNVSVQQATYTLHKLKRRPDLTPEEQAAIEAAVMALTYLNPNRTHVITPDVVEGLLYLTPSHVKEAMAKTGAVEGQASAMALGAVSAFIRQFSKRRTPVPASARTYNPSRRR